MILKIYLTSGAILGISGMDPEAGSACMDRLVKLGDEVLEITASSGGRTLVVGKHLAGAELWPDASDAK